MSNSPPHPYVRADSTRLDHHELPRLSSPTLSQFGKVGTEGQKQVKSFGDTSAAEEYATKQIASKEKSG